MPRCEYRITSQMRHARMASVAVDRERDPPSRCHHDAVMDRDRTGIESGPIVKTEDTRHGKPVEEAGSDHRAGAAIPLLGRLKDEMDRSAPACVGDQQRRCTKQRYRVPVMTAR